MLPDELRPDPDDLLAKIAAEEPSTARGELKIFFGYAAGVGKTYAMLVEARALLARGTEVAIGWVEPHARPETLALLDGLPSLPPRVVVHRGVRLHELDLDLALLTRPGLILVDELAHTNAPGARHAKRWQDVEELLQAGVDVFTTLNLQHIESLNDLVARITGVVVQETVPDRVFEAADQIELVDLPPEELLRRFREGKIYLPEQASIALERFFKPETLVALRELALRKTADQVNREVELGRRSLANRPIWATRERILVGVGSSPTSARLVRAARRMASELRAPWYAAHFESGARAPSSAARDQLQRNLELAERLGAEVVTLSGARAAEELVRFAHKNGVTKMVLGKSARSRRWSARLRPSLVDQVLRLSGEVDVFVIRGDEGEDEQPEGRARGASPLRAGFSWHTALALAASLGGAIALSLALSASGARNENVVLVFLAATVVVSAVGGRAASVAASVLSVLAFNYFFVEPRYTFVVADVQYLFTFAMLLMAGLATGELFSRLRRQAAVARSQADASFVLYRIGRALSSTTGTLQIAERARGEIERWLDLEAAIFLRDGEAQDVRLAEGIGAPRLVTDARERSIASWVLRNARAAGHGTDTLPSAAGTYLPLVGTRAEALGVLGVVAPPVDVDRSDRRMLSSISDQVALALERELLSKAVAATSARVESERTRADLLATVSHDLRTPLATIQGAASALLASEVDTPPEARRELLTDVLEESERLARLVENLLQLGRVGAGRVELRRDLYPLDELVAAALERLRRTGGTERIRVELPADLPLLDVDGDLLTQLVWNLLENALRYAPEGEIELGARAIVAPPRGLELDVCDRGPGLPPGDPEHLFERYARGATHVRATGTGLGLAIGRAIARVHGGELTAAARPGGGACFRLLLPASCVARGEFGPQPAVGAP